MFGLNTISWTHFTTLLLIICSLYYGVVLIGAWLKRSGRATGFLFENADEQETQSEGLIPISISATDYPSELIPFRLVEDVPLEINFYQDNGIDLGYNIEMFYNDHFSTKPEFLGNIQFQH